MMLSFSDDIDEILSDDDLGVSVTHATLGTFDGVFTSAFSEPLRVESASLSLLCKAADVEGIAHGDTVKFKRPQDTAALSYTVRGNEPVELEMVRLILETV